MTENNDRFHLTDLEADILRTIDNIGWYAYLWFPVISRAVLNFGSMASEEEVYAAFASLVRKHALVYVQPDPPEKEWTEIPEWKPAPGALAAAKGITF